MKRYIITAAMTLMTIMTATAQPPTLYALTQESHALPPTGGAGQSKTFGIFRSEKQVKTATTITGFTLIAAGAYLGGKAEMHRMYHGTTSDGDNFHTTRDAGLLITGAGAASIGASIVIGERIRPLELLYKGLAAPILYRVVAEATYNAYKPDR